MTLRYVVGSGLGHGECLGEHGLIQKWSIYDNIVTRVPTVIWSTAGTSSSAPFRRLPSFHWRS
jgi:hypothetical protein